MHESLISQKNIDFIRQTLELFGAQNAGDALFLAVQESAQYLQRCLTEEAPLYNVH
jgi:hypothetical protein